MMNKTILMLSVSCMSFIAGADLCYAGFNPYGTPPVLSAVMLKSHVSTHTSHLTAGHLSSLEDFAELTLPENSGRGREGFKPSLTLPKSLGRENRGELTKFLGREEKGEKIKLAAACFVTDTTNCSGNEFVGNNADEDDGGVPPGGPGDDYELDNEKRCEEEGYLLTSCPEGMKPYNFCPYDRTYFEKCVPSCPSDYVTCEPPYYGVGEACDGKYASCECTPCGSGYDYTTIPEGYIQDGEACLDCDGKTKYKIKPNPCDGFMDCGNMGPEIGAGTCQSGNETLYDNCKACPYECSLSSCPDNYTCTKEECSGMYCKSGCQPGYDWDAATQSCTEQCAYKCTLDSCPSPFTCDYEECSGKYCKTGCQPGYNWNASMQSCTSQCSSSQWYSENTGQCCSNSYQYDESNCPLSGNYHCSTNTCGGKYTDCKTLEFSSSAKTYVLDGITFARSAKDCPGIKAFVRSNSVLYSEKGDIDNGQGYILYECIKSDVDQACYDLYEQMDTNGEDVTVNINQDMYCGNISFSYNPSKGGYKIIINGNNHTITFDRFAGIDIDTRSGRVQFEIKDLNIVSNTLKTSKPDLFINCQNQGRVHKVFDGYIRGDSPSIENVSIQGNYTSIGGVVAKGTNTIGITSLDIKKLYPQLDADLMGSYIDLEDESVLNIRPVDVEITLKNKNTVNVNSDYSPTLFRILGDDAIINACSTGVWGTYEFEWSELGGEDVYRPVTVNWDGRGSIKKGNGADYVTTNVDSAICDKMNF